MEETLVINKEDLKDFSAEELVDLKIELDDMLRKVENLLDEYDGVFDE